MFDVVVGNVRDDNISVHAASDGLRAAPAAVPQGACTTQRSVASLRTTAKRSRDEIPRSRSLIEIEVMKGDEVRRTDGFKFRMF